MRRMAEKQILSDEVRRTLGVLLIEIQYQGAHIEVLRYKTSAAVIVPCDWYKRARQALAAIES